MSEYNCLVVDDSPIIREMLVLTLSSITSLRFTEAENGIDGLRKLGQSRYDLILTDINMPMMDGLKLVKCVRQDPIHCQTPIIVITTERAAEDRERALRLGANMYLVKPVEGPEVLAAVRKLLENVIRNHARLVGVQ